MSEVALAQMMDSRARSAAAAAQAKTGSSDALLQNYVTPGMSGQPITSVDNSKSFTPTISCQKTVNLLEVLVQPSATGDIGTVRISQDRDFDGNFDISSMLPAPVSGICANGIIACQPGTWNQCHYFKWDVDTAKALKLTEVAMPELAGCYCVNNSCGANLVWGNLDAILKDLGGGMVGALTTADPRVGVAQAQVNGPVIDYVGAQATSCASSPALGQTSYRGNPAQIQSDAATLAAGNSIFQILKSSPAGIGKAQQVRNCTIERQVTVVEPVLDDIISRTSGGYGETRTGTNMVDYYMGSPADNSLAGGSCTLFDFRMTLHVEDPARIIDARLVQYFADDWAQVRIDGNLIASGPSPWTSLGLPPGKCERKKTFYASSNLDLKPWLSRGDHELWLRAGVGGGGEAFAQIHVLVDDSCSSQEQLVDLCAGYATDSACHLSDEDVDGVQTFHNGVGTGLKPLPQTRLFGTGACALQLTREFFLRSRSYQCEIDTGSMPPPDLSRGAYIIDNSTATLLADQMTARDGSVTQTTSPFSLPAQAPVPACEAICKTRAPRVNTAAAPAGVVATQQNNPAGWDTFYHVCDASNVCPAGPGEQIVSACGCLDDFPEAVVMMQSVRLAGADMVCTSAVP
ncbi:MAG: hypothetical protein H6921_15010 [Sphingomonas sp.]|nr:hypothetical protein [Sphingomonas sp.]